MSLRWRIALALAAVGFVATAAVGIIGYRSASDRLISEVDRSISEATSLVAARPGGDRVPPRGLLEVYVVRLLSPRGEVVSSSFGADVPVAAETDDILGRPGNTARYTTTVAGEEYRVHAIGLQNGGAVEIGRSLGETTRVLDDLRRRTILLVVLVAVGAAGAGWLIAGTVAAPLRRLTGAAEEVESSGRLDVAVPGEGSDEVGRLGAAFRSMLGALQRSREDQERLVQDAGHELRTPLTSLRTNLAVMRRHPEMTPEMHQRILDDLSGEVAELTELVNELVAAASGRLVDQSAERLHLGEAARSVAERIGRRRSREIVVTERNPATVVAPPSGLDRAIANLVENACKFDSSGGRVDIEIDGATLTVLDRGPGIPAEEAARVFDRFHRTAEAQAMPGSGLGLSIVRDVVEAHGGSVSARPREGGGAAVGFTLPTAAATA